MKTIFSLIILISFFSFNNNVIAQEVKRPITAKVINEPIPESPGDNMTWIKGHWSWDGARYTWLKGIYVELKTGSIWIDGEWERNQRSGWWKYSEGYWQKDSDQTDVENDRNTAEQDKAGKVQRQKNKTAGLFIKTGTPK